MNKYKIKKISIVWCNMANNKMCRKTLNLLKLTLDRMDSPCTNISTPKYSDTRPSESVQVPKMEYP